MSAHPEFEFRPARQSDPMPRRKDNAQMRILLCGNFSAGESEALVNSPSLATRSVVRIDVDNLDDVIAQFAPSVSLSSEGMTISIKFDSIDDFHPDNLFAQLDIFKRLRDLRKQLQDPAQFKLASSEIFGDGNESDEETLQRLMGGTQPDTPLATPPESTASGLDALLHSIVAPHIVASSGREQEQYIRAVDSSIAEQMRSILNNSRFQAVESLWRSVQFLVTQLELDEALQLYIFDVTRAEIDTSANESEIEQSGLWKALVDQQQDATGGPGWSMVFALEGFDASRQDVISLATLASISSAAGAPVIATAASTLFGCDQLQTGSDHHSWHAPDSNSHPHWQALRASALAPWIGLVMPRLLIRLPYGKATDPLDSFEFEEITNADPRDSLLWAHSSVACALLASTAFSGSGLPLSLGEYREVHDLPAWIYQENGEPRMFPCAETWLSDEAARWLMSNGIMVLASRRDRPAAQLLGWQSIAEPAEPLAGVQ